MISAPDMGWPASGCALALIAAWLSFTMASGNFL
jgi:hypothetical protein